MNVDAKAPTGRIAGSYKTGAGETVWIIAWDDRNTRRFADVKCSETFRDGQRVRLAGDTLESC